MASRCLILGASGEIGYSTALTLIKQGYHVCLQYNRNDSAIESLRNYIPNDQWLGAVQGDLSSAEGVSDFLANISSDWDAIVFAGGHHWTGLFQDMTSDEMDQLYYVHVKAPWMVTKHVLPSMIRKKHGNIVVVSSIFGEEGASMEAVYSSVKGAQLSFVKGIAKEVGPSGIRVNAVTPGLIATKMNHQLSKEDWNSLEEEIPVGRAGTPLEVADAVAYLLSDRSSYITGHTLRVNGGWF